MLSVCVQGSNWVQKTRSLLDSLTQRTESVDRSDEAAKVRDELSVYVACTVQEQEDRVTEVRGREAVYLCEGQLIHYCFLLKRLWQYIRVKVTKDEPSTRMQLCFRFLVKFNPFPHSVWQI